jgi:hypothetical protein
MESPIRAVEWILIRSADASFVTGRNISLSFAKHSNFVGYSCVSKFKLCETGTLSVGEMGRTGILPRLTKGERDRKVRAREGNSF